MSRLDIAAIRARAEAATAPPWLAETDCFNPDEPEIEACVTNITGKNPSANLLFTSGTNLIPGVETWAKADAYRTGQTRHKRTLAILEAL